MAMWSWFRRDRAAASPPPEPDPSIAEPASAAKRRGGELLEAGRLDEAAECYAKALASSPDDVGCLVQLGFLLGELGRADEGVVHLSKALTLDPAQADAHYLLGGLALQREQSASGIRHLCAALAARPDFEQCRLALCRGLFQAGEFAQAQARMEEGLALQPDVADFHFYRGNLHVKACEPAEAARSFERATALEPMHDAARRSLARTQQALGELTSALHSYRALQQETAEDGEWYTGLGADFHRAEKLDLAIQCYEAAVRLAPAQQIAQHGWGCALHALGQTAAAIEHCRMAVALDPAFAAAHDTLAVALHAQGQYEPAIAHAQRAVGLEPGNASFQSNLGMSQQRQGALVAAEASYRRALALDPDSVNACINLGCLLQEQGAHGAAIDSLNRALTLSPVHPQAQSNLLFTLNYHPDLSAQEIYAAYRAYDERFAQPLRSTWRPHGNSKITARRLRVGYVSPDFRHHAMRHFLEPLLAHHDRAVVEVHAYAELAAEDAVTRRYRSLVDQWHLTNGIADEVLAEQIRAHEIDILVDLAGHTTGHRLGVFARKPAPVSASWLGYGYTTGSSAIDYLLTDRVVVPEGSESLFSERPWRLPVPSWAYRPAEDMGAVGPLPAQADGSVTFGTLTRAVRINDHSIGAWSAILHRVAHSRLAINSETFRDEAMRHRLTQRFEQHGIGALRLNFGYCSPPWDVLRGIDIGLDCFPHNSGTTLFESLYMGVPFVSLAGRPSVGRLGSSILHGLGHPEWIAISEEEYIEKAVALASDLPRLARLRTGLRAEMEASPLRDEAGLARKLETAFREMFALWAAGCEAGSLTPSGVTSQ